MTRRIVANYTNASDFDHSSREDRNEHVMAIWAMYST